MLDQPAASNDQAQAATPPVTAPVMELVGICKYYQSRGGVFGGSGERVTALNQVSLDFRRGEIFGLVGESGSGKTTCGRLMVGLERADAGQLVLEGREITVLKGKARKDFRRKVQIIFQDPYQSLNPQLSILDSVAEPLITNRVCPASEREPRVLTTLKAVGLSPAEDFAYRFPHQLSGGQRQRVMVARALLTRPRVIVADEPVSMVDASLRAMILDIMLRLRDEHNISFLYITHDLSTAYQIGDNIHLLYQGSVAERGNTVKVIENPKHPYVQLLINSIPVPDPSVKWGGEEVTTLEE